MDRRRKADARVGEAPCRPVRVRAVPAYPQDYNGVVAGAPAINWNRFHIMHMWGLSP